MSSGSRIVLIGTLESFLPVTELIVADHFFAALRMFLSFTFHCMDLILSNELVDALLYMAICGDISFTQILSSNINETLDKRRHIRRVRARHSDFFNGEISTKEAR